MHIRLFAPQDTQAIIDLWHRCGLTRPWNNPKQDIERKHILNDGGFVVLENALQQIVGSVMFGYDGHRGNVYYLAIHPEFQKQSLGKKLMSYVAERLELQGCPKINIMVRSDNHSVIAFYRALGYENSAVEVLGKRLIEDE